ncbi:MAG: glycosyltransferase family 1 protein [Candidatus Aminicenantes bacterium]|nr:glycosyltransferase family 1 protein [Candidatus Aminicenantes bacterium]
MKVAIYAGMFIKNQDGATKTLYELSDSLLKRNIKVGIWAFSITFQKKKGLSLFKIPAIPLYFYPEYQIAIPNFKIKKQLDAFKPDMIHIATPDLIGIFMIKYAKKKKIPLVMSYHTDFPSYLKSYKIDFLKDSVWKYFKWFYNQAEIVFVPTKEIEQKLKEKGIKNTKIWTRGIYIKKFNPTFRSKTLRTQWGADGKNVILYSGRFVWYKDLKTFIEIYNLFKERGPKNTLFVLLGTGPIEEKLMKSMPEAIFPGYLSGKKLSEAYASADIFLFPSTTETFGNVVQEALSSGIPSVVSNKGGCKEIVNNSKGGLIAKSKDAESFYQCCKRLISEKKLFKRLQDNGLRYSKKRTWKNINDKVISQYFKIYNRKRELRKRQILIEQGRFSKSWIYFLFSILFFNLTRILIRNVKRNKIKENSIVTTK